MQGTPNIRATRLTYRYQKLHNSFALLTSIQSYIITRLRLQTRDSPTADVINRLGSYFNIGPVLVRPIRNMAILPLPIRSSPMSPAQLNGLTLPPNTTESITIGTEQATERREARGKKKIVLCTEVNAHKFLVGIKG